MTARGVPSACLANQTCPGVKPAPSVLSRGTSSPIWGRGFLGPVLSSGAIPPGPIQGENGWGISPGPVWGTYPPPSPREQTENVTFPHSGGNDQLTYYKPLQICQLHSRIFHQSDYHTDQLEQLQTTYCRAKLQKMFLLFKVVYFAKTLHYRPFSKPAAFFFSSAITHRLPLAISNF